MNVRQHHVRAYAIRPYSLLEEMGYSLLIIVDLEDRKVSFSCVRQQGYDVFPCIIRI